MGPGLRRDPAFSVGLQGAPGRRNLPQAEYNAGALPMPITFLMLPPQGDRTREWARRLSRAHPELEIIAPETMEGAEQAITGAEGAYGTIPPSLLARAETLRWLQAPQAAPPAGFYYPDLIR